MFNRRFLEQIIQRIYRKSLQTARKGSFQCGDIAIQDKHAKWRPSVVRAIVCITHLDKSLSETVHFPLRNWRLTFLCQWLKTICWSHHLSYETLFYFAVERLIDTLVEMDLQTILFHLTVATSTINAWWGTAWYHAIVSAEGTHTHTQHYISYYIFIYYIWNYIIEWIIILFNSQCWRAILSARFAAMVTSSGLPVLLMYVKMMTGLPGWWNVESAMKLSIHHAFVGNIRRLRIQAFWTRTSLPVGIVVNVVNVDCKGHEYVFIVYFYLTDLSGV